MCRRFCGAQRNVAVLMLCAVLSHVSVRAQLDHNMFCSLHTDTQTRTHETGVARTYGRYACICNTLYDLYHCKRAPSHRAYILIVRYEPRIAYIWTLSMWRFCKTGNPVRTVLVICRVRVRTQKLHKAMNTTTATTNRIRKTLSFGSG